MMAFYIIRERAKLLRHPLRLQINKISIDIRGLDESIETLDDTVLVNLAKTRSKPLVQRLEAINLLIKKELKTECQSVAHDLITGLSKEEVALLEQVFTSFPDHEFAKKLFEMIFEKVNVSEATLHNALIDFLKNAHLLNAFSEFILVEQADNWHNNHHEKVKELLSDEPLTRKIINFGLKRLMLNPEVSSNIITRLSCYGSPFTEWMLEEMKTISIQNRSSFKAELEKVKSDYTEEMKKRHSPGFCGKYLFALTSK